MQTTRRVDGGTAVAVRVTCALAAIWMLALQGCGGSEISGQLSLPDDRGHFKPTGNVEVLLVKGDMLAYLAELARKHDARLVEQVTSQIVGPLGQERRSKQAELESLATSLAAMGYPPSPAEGTPPPLRVDCTERAETQTAAARQQLADRLEQLQPKLRSLGIEVGGLDDARTRIEAVRTVKLERQADLARQAYADKHLKMESSVVLSTGRSSDQLCWKLTNGGPLNLVSLDLHLTYNGRRVPQHIADQIWLIPFPLHGALLVVRNEDGQEVFGLASGATLRACFYAAAGPLAALPQDLAKYRMTRESGTRSGTWGIEADNAVLTAAAAKAVTLPGSQAARWAFEPQAATEVFAEQLDAYRRQLLETDLLAQLTTSEEAKQLERGTAALAACQKADALQRELLQIDEARTAIEQGRTSDAAVQSLIAPRIDQMKQDPRLRSPTLSEAHQAIERNLRDFRKTAADGTFVFLDVEKGRYTLIATHKTKAGTWTTWLIPIEVDGDARHSLGKDNALPGTLIRVLERQLFGTPQETKPRKGATPAPVSQADGQQRKAEKGRPESANGGRKRP